MLYNVAEATKTDSVELSCGYFLLLKESLMFKKLFAVSIFLTTCLAFSTSVQAEGDAEAGKKQAAACAGCHGEDGNSIVPTFPKLAGQHASYLTKQLLAFKKGSRNAPMMAPLAQGLNDKDIADLAKFYASQKTSANPMPTLKAEDHNADNGKHSDNKNKEAELKALLTFGGELYRNGDLEREVSACIACHGPFAEGNKPAGFPTLKGQHADYLIQTLQDFKTGTRTKASDNMMHMIAAKMTEKEIRAVAYYISVMK
jgi:cytochrome c553